MERLAIFAPMKALEEAYIKVSDLLCQERDESGYYLWARRQPESKGTLVISGASADWYIHEREVTVFACIST